MQSTALNQANFKERNSLNSIAKILFENIVLADKRNYLVLFSGGKLDIAELHMRIIILGTGYVGLVTGVCFAEMGQNVICYDPDESKIHLLTEMTAPFYEPGLDDLIERNVLAGRLHFTTNLTNSIKNARYCLVCVPTPQSPSGECDLQYIYNAIDNLCYNAQQDIITIIKSTIPVGTTEELRQRVETNLKKLGKSIQIDLVFVPEFLKESSALADCMKPDRIILGIDDLKLVPEIRELYSPFTLNHDRILVMSSRSAEMTKYAANAMLALRISFMNELSGLCEYTDANIHDVRIGIGSDQRIGHHFLYAGIGFGGSCFPKDLKALCATAKRYDYETPILESISEVNKAQRNRFIQKIKKKLFEEGNNTSPVIAIWGLSFKPETDDIRDAPSMEIIREFLRLGATLRLFDPKAMPKAKMTLTNDSLIWCKDEYDAANGADAILLLTEWKQFRFVDFDQIAGVMNRKLLFDGRNQYKPKELVKRGFEYHGVGVPSAHTIEDPSTFASRT